jgi:hypothetical protein
MTSRLALLIAGCAAAALANPDKLARDLARVAPGSKVRVIVQHRLDPTTGDLQRLAEHRADSAKHLKNTRAVEANLPAASLQGLAAAWGNPAAAWQEN